MDLRSYQLALIEEVRAAYRSGSRRVCLQLPTGAGKTVIAGQIVRLVHGRSRRGMMLVHRRELVTQAVETLRKFGHDPGVIAAGMTTQPGAWFQVASVQTLNRRLDRIALLGLGDLLIVDEAHHVAATTWEKTVNAMGRCHVLGLTATPERADGAGLSHIFDDLVVGPSVTSLARDGALSVPAVLAPAGAIDTKGMRTKYGEYHRGDMEKAGTAIIPAVYDSWKRYADGKRTIIFAVSRKVGRKISEDFSGRGVRCEYVDGSMPHGEREGIIGRFKTGATQVIVNVEIISEGFDCPECECVVQARPTMSLGLHLQQIGRAMRPGEDKVVLDLAANHTRHGLPDDHREWSLDAKKRSTKDKEAPKAVRCANCGTVMRPGTEVCPTCKARRLKRDREVVEVKNVRLAKVKPKRSRQWIQSVTERKRQAYRETLQHPDVNRWPILMEQKLRAIAKDLGYNPYWVNHQMNWYGPVIAKARDRKLESSSKGSYNTQGLDLLTEEQR